jgi:hypothetical protein
VIRKSVGALDRLSMWLYKQSRVSICFGGTPREESCSAASYSSFSIFGRFTILVALCSLAISPGISQDASGSPPARVARLGYLESIVSFQPASIDDWTPAELNYPVTNGDRIWTGADGLVELQTDNASIRLGARTYFSFLNLNDQVTQIEITAGTLNIRLRGLALKEGFEIDTPRFSFTLLRDGDYRVDVNESGDSGIVTVHAGDAEINIGDQRIAVHPGTQVAARGRDNPTLDLRVAPALDRFDAVCADRDRREEAAIASRYVSRDVPGYADLDASGAWRLVAPYGNVWFPFGLAADWAPYRYGHWGWVEPWGWTWIDDAPWGWAPFHFGRWMTAEGAWGWAPAMPITVVRPRFAPALVAFADFDPGVVVTDAAIGWLPLAFGEVYVPPFAVGAAGLAAFNFGISIGAGSNVNSVDGASLANRDYMTAMRRADFEHGRPLHGDYLHPGPEDMSRARMGRYAPVPPHRDAVLGPRGDARGHVPPQGVSNRGVQARRAVPNGPASFEHGAASRAAHPGRPVGMSERAGGGNRANVHVGAGGARGGTGGRSAGPGGRNAGPGGRPGSSRVGRPDGRPGGGARIPGAGGSPRIGAPAGAGGRSGGPGGGPGSGPHLGHGAVTPGHTGKDKQ